ncbi:peptidase S1 [Streptomyces abyssalis]|uniref:Peptidase S1 n=1 Tax=Streptomyces abyssalis TaxID=933944 RepID=A0A1E7JKE6_9ACTN|nr:serine protease [Streptomyces abyssalis]OEU88124.1 peptidase S1 [Streptomyces abyssalis]OEU90995.1 peptidase S1 [Streptomyces abyssalis]
MSHASPRRHVRRTVVGGLITTAVVAAAAVAVPAAQAGEEPPQDRSKPSTRIIGGDGASNDAYPFMVSVLTKGPGSAKKRHHCGGSLINATTVMTAAHCLPGRDTKDFQVAVGRTVLSDSGQGQIRNLEPFEGTKDTGGFLIHPRYAKGDTAYDMAFLQLSKPVKGIAPIKMPTKGTDALIRPGAKAVVTGWGNTDTDLPTSPDRLREVKVPVLSHDECAASYGEYDRKVNFCAGAEGKDSCQGDSGGPIFRNVPGRQKPIQVGIVSYGNGCAEQGSPGVYTYLGSEKLWKTMSESAAGKLMKEQLGR